MKSYLTSLFDDLNGWQWRFFSVVCGVVIGSIFNFTPWILDRAEISRFDSDPQISSYQEKVNHPLSNTTPTDGDVSGHISKLTPRIGIPILLNILNINSYFEYSLYSFFSGLILFFSANEFVFYQTRNRKAALGSCVLLSLVTTPAHVFSFTPWLFDPGSIALSSLLLITFRNRFSFSVNTFLALWSDERAIITVGTILAMLILLNNPTRNTRAVICAAIMGFAVFIGSRMIATSLFDWTISFDGTGLDVFHNTWRIMPISLLIAFEGVFLIAFHVIFRYWRAHDTFSIFVFILLFGSLALLTCSVMDVSRAIAFSFPIIPGMTALGLHNLSITRFRESYWIGCFFSATTPSFIIIFQRFPSPDIYLIAATPFKLIQQVLVWLANM